MKVIIVSLLGLAALFFGGWSTVGQPVAHATEEQTPSKQVVSIQEIVGTWHAFPIGVLLQFDDDGSAHFGLDSEGTLIGREARIWFENQGLSILFTEHDDQIDGCSASVGHYNVELSSDGTIRFESVHDDCQFRVQILQGAADTDSRMIYHPVQGW